MCPQGPDTFILDNSDKAVFRMEDNSDENNEFQVRFCHNQSFACVTWPALCSMLRLVVMFTLLNNEILYLFFNKLGFLDNLCPYD